MNAFATAARAIFADANMASGADYRAGGLGVAVPVRVILRSPDQVATFGDGRFLTDAVLLDVLIADLAVVETGDTFQIDAVVYTVRADPMRDVQRLCWTCEVKEE